MSSMLSSVQLQATGCKFAVFRARARLLGSAKAVPARMHPLPVFRGWNQSILQKDRYAFVSGITPWPVQWRRVRDGGHCNRTPLTPVLKPPPEEPQLNVREQCERDWHRRNECYEGKKAQGVTP